eukprot:scaffold3505_cov170-Amphora_coffeaeformis.AAC.5
MKRSVHLITRKGSQLSNLRTQPVVTVSWSTRHHQSPLEASHHVVGPKTLPIHDGQMRYLSTSSTSSSVPLSPFEQAQKEESPRHDPPPTPPSSRQPSSIQQKTTGQVWRQISDQLLQQDTTVVALRPQDEQNLKECIRWWARQRPITPTSQEYVWKLWERFGRFLPNESTAELWLTVVDHWRLAIEEGMQPSHTPEHVLNEIQSLSLEDSTKSYGILLDVLSQLDRPHDAENLLTMTLASNPSTVLRNTVLTAWVRSHDPDATKRAVALFHRIPQVDEISFALVLEALANGLASNPNSDLIGKVEEIFARAVNDGKVSEVAWLYRLQAWGSVDKEKAKSLLYSLRQEYLTEAKRDGKTDLITPNQRLFTTVMSAFAKVGDFDTVRQLWEDLKELDGRHSNDQVDEYPFRPSSATLSTVLLSFGRARVPDRAEKAQALLESAMEHTPDIVDRTAFNIVVDSWAGSPNKQNIEAIRDLIEYMKQRGDLLQPDTYTYNALLKAYSKSNRRDALKVSRQVLKAMWNAYDAGSEIEKPNHVSYSTILFNYSRLASPDELRDAESLFAELWKEYYRGNDPDLLPSESAYVSIITTWIRSKRKEAPARAAYYFDHMRAKHAETGDPRFQPSVRIYNTLIDSHKLSADGPGAERILHRMIEDYRRGNAKAEPTTVTFNTVMTVFMKSKDRRAPQKIESILREMERLAKSEGWSCYPNTWTYTIVLEAWSNLRSIRGAERAEEILWGLQSHSETTRDKNIRPCTYCYTTCINAWSKSGSPYAPEKATVLFDEMMRRFQLGDEKLKPSSITYSAVLTAWSRSSRRDAPTRALALVNEMVDRHQMDPNRFIKPDSLHYSSVIDAFAEHGDVENAEALLNRMLVLSPQSGVHPNRGCWNGVLKAYARSRILDGPERAVQLLDRMYTSESHKFGEFSPDAYIFTTLLEVWRLSGRKDAFQKGLQLVDEMIARAGMRKRLQPDAGVFLVLLRILGESEIKDKSVYVEKLVGMMQQQNIKVDRAIRIAIAECRSSDGVDEREEW